MCPFECDSCTFARLMNRPGKLDGSDSDVWRWIRRANLDAFWSREPRTVDGNLKMILREIRECQAFGYDPFDPWSPMPSNYNPGTRAAIAMIRDSEKSGRHEKTKKWSAVRKTRTVFSHIYSASGVGVGETSVAHTDRSRIVTSRDPTRSEWFSRFSTGLAARLGKRIKQDAAISIQVMVKLQEYMESDWQNLAAGHDRTHLEQFGTFVLFAFCGSMRGYEVPKTVLTYIRRHIVTPDQAKSGPHRAHIGIPLAGRFKLRSNQEQKMLLLIAAETASGLSPVTWIQRLIQTLESKGVQSGWLFQTSNGDQMRMTDFENLFYGYLRRIQEGHPELIAPDMDIEEEFGLARSFRRGSNTHARNQGVDPTIIDWINRWNTGEGQSNLVATGSMQQLYSDARQMLSTFLRYSEPL